MGDRFARSEHGVIPALRWEEPSEGLVLVLLDQTRLPQEEVELVRTDVQALVAAIRSLAVRGAPLLRLAGAYGIALAAARGIRRRRCRGPAGARPSDGRQSGVRRSATGF